MSVESRIAEPAPEATMTHAKPISRNRLIIACGILAVIGLGLASRTYPVLFPALFGKYPGDVLWALMVYLIWSFLKPTVHPLRITALAILTAVLIELSQLIQTPELIAIRHTTLGHLILGTVFSWEDLLAYAVGIGFGLLLDSSILFRQPNKSDYPTNHAGARK